MTKTFLRLFCLLSFFSITAIARTPIESFIYYVKEAHNFAPVNNLWQPNNEFDKTVVSENLSRVQGLRMDAVQLSAFMKQNNFAVELTLPGIGGGSYTLELAKYDFRSDGFV